MTCPRYRRLHGYKYQLLEDYSQRIPWAAGHAVEREYYAIADDGTVTARCWYAWDGASGPTLDWPRCVITASLVHDVLYQAIQAGDLPATMREDADRLLHAMLLGGGMWGWRAKAWLWAVRRFGARHARPRVPTSGKAVPNSGRFAP